MANYNFSGGQFLGGNDNTVYSRGATINANGGLTISGGVKLDAGGGYDTKAAENTAKALVKDAFNYVYELGDQTFDGGEGASHKGSSSSGAVVENVMTGKVGQDENDNPQYVPIEPMDEESMRYVNSLPMSPTLDAQGAPITKDQWASMTAKKRLEAVNATNQAHFIRNKLGLTALPEVIKSGSYSTSEIKALMRGEGTIDSPDTSAWGGLRDANLLPQWDAQGDVDNTNLSAFIQKQADGEVFLPREVNPILAGGAQINKFKMNKGISDAMAYGNSVSIPSDFSPTHKEASINARNKYKRLVAEGVIKDVANFNPPQKIKSGKPQGPSPQAIKKAATYHGTFEMGPQKYSNNNFSAKADNVFFDDICGVLNIKDPSSGYDSGANSNNDFTGTMGSGGPDFTRRQKISNVQVLYSKGDVYSKGDGPDDNITTNQTFRKVRHAKCHPRDQPKGSIFIGKATSTGGKSGSCGIIAPPNSSIPSKYNDVPRLDLFTCGVNTTDVSTGNGQNKNLVRRIINDFKEAGKDVTIGQIAADSGTWSNATLDSTHISPDMFRVRAGDVSAGKLPLFKDSNSSNADIEGLPPIKERSFTFDGETRTYQVLDSSVRIDTRKLRKTIKPNKSRSIKMDKNGHILNTMCGGKTVIKALPIGSGGSSIGPFNVSSGGQAIRCTCSGFGA